MNPLAPAVIILTHICAFAWLLYWLTRKELMAVQRQLGRTIVPEWYLTATRRCGCHHMDIGVTDATYGGLPDQMQHDWFLAGYGVGRCRPDQIEAIRQQRCAEHGGET